jgi:lysophospholipid hydrolase
VLHIDIALEWMQVGAGQIIYKQGEPSDSIFMVLHGRLRTIQEKKGGEIAILDEFGHGDSVGDLELLSKLKRREREKIVKK